MLHPRSLTARPWKGTISVGNTSSNHWFSGAMLNFGRLHSICLKIACASRWTNVPVGSTTLDVGSWNWWKYQLRAKPKLVFFFMARGRGWAKAYKTCCQAFAKRLKNPAQRQTHHQNHGILCCLPSWELEYPLLKVLLKMMFLFSRWDMLVPWRIALFKC